MTTPVWDFVRAYAASGVLRLHMPGHKGRGPLGCEGLDLTEVAGADSLYHAEGILAESEANAASLFGAGRTLYATEGSSQCIRAMVYLALSCRAPGTPPRLLAARNVHSAFVSACALCGAEVGWLWPERRDSLCACEISPEALERALAGEPAAPAGVYVTSPDYLGNLADLRSLAEVCRRFGVPLLVDNAHGAALKFLPGGRHPMDAGAAICCDSAHKTLPVLTGGAYLHISAGAPAGFAEGAKRAMALFGSTSPSYLVLASLDRCNGLLAGPLPEVLARTAETLAETRRALSERGWHFYGADPLRLTLRGGGQEIAARLRRGGIEPEYADRDFCVLMAAPDNPPDVSERLLRALGDNDLAAPRPEPLPPGRCERVCAIREAMFAPCETIAAADAAGRICGAPSVSCPPAVPPVITGERISPEAAALFRYYGISEVTVLKGAAGC